MQIRLAKPDDLPVILNIYETARRFMRNTGNPEQWGTAYPPVEMLTEDISVGRLYVLADGDGLPHAVFMISTEADPTYLYIENGAWLNDNPYAVIHRIATDGTVHGAVAAVLDHCRKLRDDVRIDTHADNSVMQHVLEKNGFVRCGTIYLENGDPRIAYQWSRSGKHGTGA